MTQLLGLLTGEGQPDGIMEGWAGLLDQLRLAVGPGAVGQQHGGDRCVEVDPERTAAKTQMPDGVYRKMTSCRGGLRWGIPTERARAAFRPLAQGETLDCIACKERRTAFGLAASGPGKNLAREAQQV